MLGERLKALREERKLTQEKLGKALGLSPSAIGMYEQNRRIPDLYTLQQIATFFNVSIDHLVRCEQYPQKTYNNKNLIKQYKQYKKIISSVKTFFADSNIDNEEKEKLFRDITETFWKSRDMNNL